MSQSHRHSVLLVLWRSVMALDVEWEEAFLDAVDRVRGRGYVVEHVRRIDEEPDVIVVAYPASAHGAQQIRDTVHDLCGQLQALSASRLAIVACGRSDRTLSDGAMAQDYESVTEVAGGHLMRALSTDHLREEADRWMHASIRRLFPTAVAPRRYQYSAEDLIEEGATHEGRDRWPTLGI